MKQIVAPFLVFLSLNCFSQQPKPVTAVPKINQVYTTPPDSLYLNVGGTNGFHNLARYKEVKRLNDSVAALRSGINLKLNKSDTASLSQRINLKAPLASPTFTGTVSGVTKAMVGLGSVDNTTDAGKTISTLTQTALNLKANYDFTTVTKAQADALITASTLVKGAFYKITGVHPTLYNDGTNSGTTIILQAIETNKFSEEGVGIFYNPKYNQSVAGFGVWSNRSTWVATAGTGNFNGNELVTANNGATGQIFTNLEANVFIALTGNWAAATSITGNVSAATATITTVVLKSYAIGAKAIWGGYSWTNVNGNVGARTDILTLNSEWSKDVYSISNYNLATDAIIYDYGHNWINRRYEAGGDNDVIWGFAQNCDKYAGTCVGISAISVFMYGNHYDTPFTAWRDKGVYGNRIYDSYFECVDFTGRWIYLNDFRINSWAQDNIWSGNSYIDNNVFESHSGLYGYWMSGNTYLHGIQASGFSYLSNGSYSGSSNVNYITMKNKSYQTGVISIGTTTMFNFSLENEDAYIQGDRLINSTLYYNKSIIKRIDGSTRQSGNLTLSTTTNTAKGKILFGNSAYSEVDNRLGIGNITPLSPIDIVKDGGVADIAMKSYGGAGTNIIGSSANGTELTPTATTSGQNLFVLGAKGYGTSFAASSRVAIIMASSEAWTATAQGTAMHFGTTGNGTASRQTRMSIENNGNVGLGITATARLHLPAGSAIAGTAPLKFNSGPLLTTPEVGAFGFLNDKLHFTITTGASRKEITLNDVALTSGIVPVTTTDGRLTNSAVTSTEQSYLSGVTSGIQPQFTGKLTKSGDIITGDIGNTSTGFFRIASGTTAQRPATPLDGMRRYNSSTLRDEFYANGAWQNHARLSGDTFTGQTRVQSGSVSLLIGADNNLTTLTDITQKNGRVGIPHYTNAASPATIFLGESTATVNSVKIGGGSSLMNAATSLEFFTAANNTTPTGTLRMSINSAGNAVFNGTVTAPTFIGALVGNANTVTTNANLTGDVTSVGNAATLPTVNANVGAFTNANLTVNAKGQVTAVSNGSGGSGTVTNVSVATANGVSGTVATSTTTPAITLSLGAITPTSTNGVSAATMAFNDATSSIQGQLNGRLPVVNPTATGTLSATNILTNSINFNYVAGASRKMTANGYGGAIELKADNGTAVRYARIGIVNDAGDFLGGLMINSDLSAKLESVPVTSVSSYDVLTRNTSTGNIEKMPSFAPVPLFDNYTTVGNVTTVETDLSTYTTTANRLGTNGDKIIAEYGGSIFGSAAAKTLKVHFAGTVIYNSGATTFPQTEGWNLRIFIIRVSATVVRYKVITNRENGGTFNLPLANGELTGLTLSNTSVLKVTGTGTANNDVTLTSGTGEWKPAAL